MPTPQWISRVEIYFGSDLIESVYADDLYHETVGTVTNQYYKQIESEINSSNYDLNTVGIPVGASRYYIPLNTCLTAMRPFVAGFSAKIKVRVYFASSISADPVVANPNPANTIALNEAQLYVGEATMSAEERKKVEDAHHGCVDYSILVRERQQEALSFNGSASTPMYLRSFKNDSAGLMVYVQGQNGSNSSHLALAPVTDLTLQDSVGNKLTEQQPADFLKTFVWGDSIDSPYTTTSTMIQPTGANLYLLPFSASFQETLRGAVNFGKRMLTSQERLIITPYRTGLVGGTPSSAIVTVLSYSYGHIVCVGGKHYVQMTSSAH
jgi:hypothetical protein